MVQRHRGPARHAEGGRGLSHYYVVEKGDDAAVDNLLAVQSRQMQRLHAASARKRSLQPQGRMERPSAGRYAPITSSPGSQKIADLGIDGMILNWVDYIDGMQRWEKDVMPRLEQAGLRRPRQ